jgi:hypothetical protein
MDLAKENKSNFKLNRRLITLLLDLPSLWLIFHLFTFGSDTNNSGFGSEFINQSYINGRMIEEFEKYRNYIFIFYAVLMVGVGFSIMTRRKLYKEKISTDNSDQKNPISYIIPASIQGIILATFSYAIAEFLLEAYFFIKNII